MLTNPQRKLALWQAFIAFYLTLTAGASLADIVGSKTAGVLAMLGAALNAGTVTYLTAIRPPTTVEGQRDAAA